jgi:hypothetical protein
VLPTKGDTVKAATSSTNNSKSPFNYKLTRGSTTFHYSINQQHPAPIHKSSIINYWHPVLLDYVYTRLLSDEMVIERAAGKLGQGIKR